MLTSDHSMHVFFLATVFDIYVNILLVDFCTKNIFMFGLAIKMYGY